MTETDAVVNQAAGMVSVQLAITVDADLLALNAQAMAISCGLFDLVTVVVERRFRFSN